MLLQLHGSVACRLSRSPPAEETLRQGVWCFPTCSTLRRGSDIAEDPTEPWTDTSSTPAVQEPIRLSNERSRTRRESSGNSKPVEGLYERLTASAPLRLQATCAVASRRRNVRRGAQGQPHVPGRYARIECVGRRSLPQIGEHQIRDQRRSASAELIRDSAIELRSAHRQ